MNFNTPYYKFFTGLFLLVCITSATFLCGTNDTFSRSFNKWTIRKDAYDKSLTRNKTWFAFLCSCTTGLARLAWLHYKKADTKTSLLNSLGWGTASFFISVVASGMLGYNFFSRIPYFGNTLKNAYEAEQRTRNKIFASIENGKIYKDDLPLRQSIQPAYYEMLDEIEERIEKFEKKTTASNFKDILEWQGPTPNQINQVIDQLNKPDIYQKYGISLPRGILLLGKPGTGKTFAGKYIAQKTGSEFIYVKTSDLYDKWVGESQKHLNAIYLRAKRRARVTGKPVIVFFDEFDSLGGKRKNDITATDHVHKNMLNTLLQILDGGEKLEQIVTIMASNEKLSFFDEALSTRNGRIQYIVDMKNPDKDTRLKMLLHAVSKHKDCTQKIPHTYWEDLAQKTEGFTPDALYNMIEKTCRETIFDALQANTTPELEIPLLEKEFNDTKNRFSLLKTDEKAPDNLYMMYA